MQIYLVYRGLYTTIYSGNSYSPESVKELQRVFNSAHVVPPQANVSLSTLMMLGFQIFPSFKRKLQSFVCSRLLVKIRDVCRSTSLLLVNISLWQPNFWATGGYEQLPSLLPGQWQRDLPMARFAVGLGGGGWVNFEPQKSWDFGVRNLRLGGSSRILQSLRFVMLV